MLGRMWEQEEDCALSVLVQIDAATVGSVELPEKLRIELPYDPQSHFLVYV